MKGLGQMTEQELLDTQISQLQLNLERSPIWPAIKQLYAELEDRGIYFKPHLWFSGEWFSPDNIPGIAIPFYLGHPRLLKLEKKMMLEAEGGSFKECMKILRHEAAHTLDTAYNLHRRRDWRAMFGSYYQEYPSWYQPHPNSRNFVVHLKGWYAQAHPAEDFAETFAVWLAPKSRWRQRYKEWPALAKLEYVNRLMGEIAGKPAQIKSSKKIEPLNSLKETLSEHYHKKQSIYSDESPEYFDMDLRRIFTEKTLRNKKTNRQKSSAARFIRKNRAELRALTVKWTGSPAYNIDRLLQALIERCRELDLVLDMPPSQTRRHLSMMLAVQTMNVIHNGKYKFAL